MLVALAVRDECVPVPVNDAQRLVEEIFREVFNHEVERVDEEDEKRSDLRVRDGDMKYIIEVKGRREDAAYERALAETGEAEQSTKLGYRNKVASILRGAVRQLEATPKNGVSSLIPTPLMSHFFA